MSFKLFLGPMYAGKTSRVMLEYNIETAEGIEGVIFKHHSDTRYSNNNEIISHGKISLPAIIVKTAKEITEYLNKNKFTKVVAIDELHFFDVDIVNVIDSMIKKDISVLASGLNCDYRRIAWNTISHCIPLCTHSITICNGKCKNCKTPSIWSYKIDDEKDLEHLEIKKSTNTFIPLCTKCYYAKYE